ncbi:MAG TPA: catalase family protein [Bacteriovoracaceae bacterium]|nr:catalase family protein [Bacteriovoracaceae bacterium]
MKPQHLLSLMLILSSCGQFPSRKIASSNNLGQENVPDGEEQATREILELVAKGYSQRSSQAPVGRIIHHKEHGCVHAELKILDNLPPSLRQGVFKQARSYPTWVRVSNGSGARKHDGFADGRGLALKLMSVDGEKLAGERRTQDFLLQSAPNFFAKDVADYVKFMKLATAHGLQGVGELMRNVNLLSASDRESLQILAASGDLPSNPLTANYFSALPQKLGPYAMKLMARRCPHGPEVPVKLSERLKKDYLKTVMARQLASSSACIELLVQVQTDPKLMPIENARVTWDPNLSPFVPVAHLLIPMQNFLSQRRKTFCENLAFNPWHSTPEHRPLGGLNRVRKQVYEHSQIHRHNLNNDRTSEPTPGDTHE